MSALEKLLKGEVLTEEEKATITPEQIEEAKKKGLESVEALRLERRRLEDKKAEDEKNQTTEFSKKYLEEQTNKAEQFVFAELTAQGIELTEEKKAQIREKRKKLDSGFVTYDNLVDDFYSAAAVVERKNLFEDRRKRIGFEKNAAEFTASQAGAQGGSANAGGTEGKTYSQDVWDMVKQAQLEGINLTPEEAHNSLTKGLKRVYK